MCTDRQRLYLRDLGVDPTAPLGGLPKEVVSEWIDELKELVSRASLPVGQPLTSAVVHAVGGREGALRSPPRTLSVAVPGPSEIQNGAAETDRPTSAQSPAEGSWWKLELHATVTVGEGRTVTISVSGSEHRRCGLREEDAQLLASRPCRARSRDRRHPRASARWRVLRVIIGPQRVLSRVLSPPGALGDADRAGPGAGVRLPDRSVLTGHRATGSPSARGIGPGPAARVVSKAAC